MAEPMSRAQRLFSPPGQTSNLASRSRRRGPPGWTIGLWIRLVLNQIGRRLTEDLHARDRRHRVLMMLDEFPALGRLDFFESALAFMAGYGLKSFLIAQSLNQIEKAYGPNNAILDNCHVRVSFATNDERTAKRVSDALGTATEMKAMRNYAGHRLSPWLGHLMVSRSETARPLLTPGEVMQLPATDEIVMAAGVHPIRAKKARYFEDRRFKERILPSPDPAKCGRSARKDAWSELKPQRPDAVLAAGPGLRAGVKPDLAHIGGAGSQHPKLGHGLFSILPDGTIVDGCGTSYAAPLAAKTAAVLDHAIEGEVSRETLIGLLVHHAEMPTLLQDKALAPIAKHMVGFGMPPSADRILETGDHTITLVFASRIQRDQQINFRFQWPASLVGPEGKCRGRAKITLVSTPPLDARFGSEFVRVNINAVLQQEQANGGWKGRLEPLYLPSRREAPPIEAERIEHDLKWSPVKVLAKTFPQGVGPSSNWRLFVEYLTRAGEVMPEEGVPFTVIVTISDPDAEQPVFNDMRQNLQALGIQIADIRTAARITPRV